MAHLTLPPSTSSVVVGDDETKMVDGEVKKNGEFIITKTDTVKISLMIV